MKTDFHPHQFQDILLPLLSELMSLKEIDKKKYSQVVKKQTKPGGVLFSKDEIIAAYRYFVEKGLITVQDAFIEKIKMKPVRTGSGVTPVTVLTKPFPCPGTCIFCPNDVRMPKSYLHDEPGAQRAERNQFDPYLQTYNRLLAYRHIGHDTDKVEIIILGGTWSFYPEQYQIWYIKRCFEAMNDFSVGIDQRDLVEHKYAEKLKKLGVQSRTQNHNVERQKIHGVHFKKTYNQVISELYTAPDKLMHLDSDETASWEELFAQHKKNETASTRCVGLVIETRPDNISEAEVLRIRKLGCTKTQIGVQSLNDEVLKLNKRGHDVHATRKAFRLLRQAGLKIHAHWMPNLYGSNPEQDIKDFQKLFSDPDFCPDELKIYPCSLIDSAELMQYFKNGKWEPYTREELLHVLTECMKLTPEYTRLTRIIRDIPSTDIVEGNKTTNFREIAEKSLMEKGIVSRDIRAREIKNRTVDETSVHFRIIKYQTSVSDEHFLQYETNDGYLLGFLRLSLPTQETFISELGQSSIIREVHVYGQTMKIGHYPSESSDSRGKAQHLGLGKKLIQHAQKIAKESGYQKLQVISAVGTREYYRKVGFKDGTLYQYMDL